MAGRAPAVYLANGIAQPSGIAVDIGFRHRTFVDLILQGFHSLGRQTFYLPVTVRVCKIYVLRVLKMMQQFHFQPVADSISGSQPNSMDDHVQFPSFSIL